MAHESCKSQIAVYRNKHCSKSKYPATHITYMEITVNLSKSTDPRQYQIITYQIFIMNLYS